MSGRHYLLFEETDESDVVELSMGLPAARMNSVDQMKYPLAGTTNARSTLKLLDIRIFTAVGKVYSKHIVHAVTFGR